MSNPTNVFRAFFGGAGEPSPPPATPAPPPAAASPDIKQFISLVLQLVAKDDGSKTQNSWPLGDFINLPEEKRAAFMLQVLFCFLCFVLLLIYVCV